MAKLGLNNNAWVGSSPIVPAGKCSSVYMFTPCVRNCSGSATWCSTVTPVPYATPQLSLSPVAAPRGQLWRSALSVPTTTSVNQNTAEASRAPNAAKTPAKLGVENRGRQTPGAETHRICSSCHILFWQTLTGNITAPHHLDLNEHGTLFHSRACSIFRQACASRFCRIRYRFSILIHPETKSAARTASQEHSNMMQLVGSIC